MGLGATDLNLLIALEALLEEGSVTRAAARLGTQQPAMSGTLSRLRRHYGDELLVRLGRDYELTPFAKSLLPAVQETMRLMREAFGVDAGFDAATSDRTFTLICSDYVMTVLYEPLQQRVRSAAPGVRLELSDLPADLLASDRGLLRQDFVIGPLGYAFPGEHELLFRDRFVCIVDARNSRLRDGTLNMRDLAEMRHAIATFPGVNITPADRFFGELGLRRRVLVRTNGFLPLPFAVQGTDSVAVVPERLARRFAGDDRWAVVEPPFGQVDMLEGLWWHPSRAADPGHRWLLSRLRDVAAELSAGEPRPTAQDEHGMVRGILSRWPPGPINSPHIRARVLVLCRPLPGMPTGGLSNSFGSWLAFPITISWTLLRGGIVNVARSFEQSRCDMSRRRCHGHGRGDGGRGRQHREHQQRPGATRVTAPVVDMHAHLAVPEADALAAAAGGAAAEQAAERALYSPESLAVNRLQLGALGAKLTDVGTRLADMTAMGVDVQVVGPMPMHHYWADAVLARKLARVTNEAVAGHCAAEPHRLAGLGTVPLQHPELAVEELSYAVTELGLAGISISTSVAGRELDDPAHEQVWAAAASLGAIVLIHPWGCSLGARLAGNYLGNIIGQPAETAIALSRIIFGGVLDRHPRLRFCAAHGGGYLPTYIGRSDHGWRTRPDARGCAAPPSSYLRRVWFDSLVYTPEGLTHLVSTVGPDQVVLGTDYPFDMGVTDPLARLDAARGLDETVLAAIAGANAWRLLGRGR